MIYMQLFLSFLQIGLFSFGGGYAALPLIENQVITLHHWMTAPEFTDLITISQMTPGPIAVNSATFVGIRIAGIPGAVAATAGCVLHHHLYSGRSLSEISKWLPFKRRSHCAAPGSRGHDRIRRPVCFADRVFPR